MNKTMRLIPDFYTDNDNPNGDIKEAELQEIPNGYLDCLEIQDALETSPDDQIIEKVCAKIKSGGNLSISGVDAASLAMRVAHGSTALDSLGDYVKVANRLHSLNGLTEYFMLRKWNIVSASIVTESYNLEVQKP